VKNAAVEKLEKTVDNIRTTGSAGLGMTVRDYEEILDAITMKDAEIEALTKYIKIILTTMKKEVLLSNNETFLFLVADMLDAANYAVDEEFGLLRGPVQDKG
jgi:hypothetical protein